MNRAARRARRCAAAPVLAFGVLVLAGCASGSPAVPTAGVDGLVIPTPSPDPSDFVEVVDNPYLPLAVGSTWTYTIDGAEPGSARAVSVADGPSVSGVATTAVRSVTTLPPGEVIEDVTDLYAQDTRGNVWWFGREGEWQAGTDGAQAGMAMLSRPRIGDGYRQGFAEGVTDLRVEVLDLDESSEVPAGSFEELVTTETVSPSLPGLVTRSYYARGTGLVLRETVGGSRETTLELAAYDDPLG